jgi:asparagine synthase (glutamine-hydrolysing)
LIRCGAFCFTTDRASADAAAKSASRMTVAGAELHIREGDDVGLRRAQAILSFDYEGSSLPAVHGYLREGEEHGECSMISLTGGDLEASRDYCGTRPLYMGESGKWVASDHRFFPQEPRELLVPGTVVSLGSGKRSVRHPIQERFEGSFDDAAAKLASLIRTSVKARATGRRRVAVAFSGGLDSSIVALCAAEHSKVVACTVSTETSADTKVARDAAGVLGVEFAGMVVNDKRLREELRDVALPFEPTQMDSSLWCIYSTTARLASESGAEVVMLGQLADELFGGYAKYEAALRKSGHAEADKMMSEDVAQCGMRGFIRDEAACRRWCEPRFPFAEQELAMFGESLPASFKIRNGVRKAVLREAARILGLPEELASRPKKAAQYSSGVMKSLS